MNANRFFLIRYEPVHSRMIEGIVNTAGAEQVRKSPITGLNTIAWLLWHMARAEDVAVSRFVGHCPQLFFNEGWAERINVPDSDFGVGMTVAEVSELSSRVNLEALKDYWAAVEKHTRSIVETLSPEDLDEVNDADYIRQVVREDGMLREAGKWGEDYWAGMPDRSKGFFLGYMGLTHNWVHFSEADVILSLLGSPEK